MVREAEEHAEADKVAKQNVEAKNQLEAYLYSLRTSVQESLKDKLSAEDKESLEKTVADALHWLEENPSATKSEYDEHRASVEAVAGPIISKAYNAKPPSDDDQAPPSDDNDGPTVEEVD